MPVNDPVEANWPKLLNRGGAQVNINAWCDQQEKKLTLVFSNFKFGATTAEVSPKATRHQVIKLVAESFGIKDYENKDFSFKIGKTEGAVHQEAEKCFFHNMEIEVATIMTVRTWFSGKAFKSLRAERDDGGAGAKKAAGRGVGGGQKAKKKAGKGWGGNRGAPRYRGGGGQGNSIVINNTAPGFPPALLAQMMKGWGDWGPEQGPSIAPGRGHPQLNKFGQR